ncbi:hypothetical protein [Duganella radicis]|uniref:Uncharacterized protein n=1 Tax=Duganella radicis TaxID=551988 RepID=A0A6L6PPG7_9BURK|nr:hypothetical protein [Duganella radicis]MTV40940.1 hypothetical protein [Duganella radicis]
MSEDKTSRFAHKEESGVESGEKVGRQKGYKASHSNCIFCGKYGELTREHKYAEWMEGPLPLEPGYINHKHKTTWFPNHLTEGPGDSYVRTKTVSGHPGSSKLRVVCAQCNNNWMSVLQKRSKGLITEALLGGWPDFGSNIRLIAEWALMTTMVFEFDHPLTVDFTAEERKAFKENRAIPSTVAIWIGLAPQAIPSRSKAHRSYVTEVGKFQATTIHLGMFLIQVVSLPELDPYTVAAKGYRWGMRTVWPYAHPLLLSTKPPLQPALLIDKHQQRLTDFMVEYMGEGIREIIPIGEGLPYVPAGQAMPGF